MPEAHAIIFMVDSTDRARFEEARDVRGADLQFAAPPSRPPGPQELHDLLENPALSDTLVAVMLNKVDLPVRMGRVVAGPIR